jgi:hypothetical protein
MPFNKNILNSAMTMTSDNCFPKNINALIQDESLSFPLYTCYCAIMLVLTTHVETNPAPASNDELLAELSVKISLSKK